MKFNVGDHVKCGDDEGFITFVGDPYFTLCVRQWEDPNSMHGYRQCNLLIYRNDWHKCTITRTVDSSSAPGDAKGT